MVIKDNVWENEKGRDSRLTILYTPVMRRGTIKHLKICKTSPTSTTRSFTGFVLHQQFSVFSLPPSPNKAEWLATHGQINQHFQSELMENSAVWTQHRERPAFFEWAIMYFLHSWGVNMLPHTHTYEEPPLGHQNKTSEHYISDFFFNCCLRVYSFVFRTTYSTYLKITLLTLPVLKKK